MLVERLVKSGYDITLRLSSSHFPISNMQTRRTGFGAHFYDTILAGGSTEHVKIRLRPDTILEKLQQSKNQSSAAAAHPWLTGLRQIKRCTEQQDIMFSYSYGEKIKKLSKRFAFPHYRVISRSSVAFFLIHNTPISYGLICTVILDTEKTDHIEVSSLYVREQPHSFIINNLKSILLPFRQ